MNVLAVIPARYASTRFPGKPLAVIHGKSMIQRVYDAVTAASGIKHIVVATDDERIAEEVQRFDGNVRMTSADHPTGTDRVAEVSRDFPEYDFVLNIQGDQPFVQPAMIQALLDPWKQGQPCQMTTLGCPFESPDDMQDPNKVKVICAADRRALYFSRAPIPFFREVHDAPVFHHLGLYGFTRKFLLSYASLPQTPLEQCEQLEQLRVLENGFRIDVAKADAPTIEVNTPADLAEANRVGDPKG